MNQKRFMRDFLIINGTCIVAIGFAFLLLVLQRYKILPSPDCTFLTITHMYCPGCGGTRALFSMLSGNIMKSLYYNPAVVLGTMLIAYYEIGSIYTIVKNDGRYHFCKIAWPVYVYTALVVIYAIVRNVLLLHYGIDMLGNIL